MRVVDKLCNGQTGVSSLQGHLSEIEPSARSRVSPSELNSMFSRFRGPGTRIFSPLAVPGLCVSIGRYVYLFKRLTAL